MKSNDKLDNLKTAVDFEKNYLKKLSTERNIALGVDSLSNLASVLARSRGARYSISTNNAAAVNRKISESEQRLLDAQRDYNGRMAAIAFQSLMNSKIEEPVAPTSKDSKAKVNNVSQSQYKPLFSQLIQLKPQKVPRRPQLIELKPYAPVRPLPMRITMKKNYKKTN